VGAVLQAREPGNTAHEEEERDVEVEPQPEDVMSGIHAQQLLANTTEGVAGDVEGEQPRRTNAAVVPEPDEHSGET
jgi:hypothetical protein